MSADEKNKFQPIQNPYIVGNPIKDQRMFFGREDDFKYIRRKVTGGKKGGLLVLCGSRRSGKTSILFQIMNGRLGEDFLPALIDMQAMTVESDLDFLIKLAQAIIDTIDDPEISLEKDFLAKRGEGSLVAFQSLIGKINQRLEGRKLVLMFDEYEIFESHISKGLISTEILNLFANWVEHKEGVFIVFTGSDKLEERTAEYWGRFLGKALHRRISFLSRSDTLRLIEEPVAGVVSYEEGLPEKIYELTAGQPFYTQVFCQALVDHLNEVRELGLSTIDLQNVIDQIIENPLPQMIFSWNSLSNIEKLSLSVIGELNKESVTPVRAKEIPAFAKREKIGYRVDSGVLGETLEKLFYHDILDKHGPRDAYTFKMDLWRRWIARMHSIWQVVDEIKSREKVLGEGITRVVRRRGRAVALFAGVAVVAAVMVILGRNMSQTGGEVVQYDSTTVTIATTPPGAAVFLGNRRIGRSPIENMLVRAQITPLRIELRGYKDFVDTLNLHEDGPVDRSIALVEKTGHLHVRSTPSGAKVYLNDEDTAKKTPAEFERLSINRSYEVRLELRGYDPLRPKPVRLYEDSTIVITHPFVQSTSTVIIDTEPAGAEIIVDGRSLGQTPNVVTLTHGSHRLVLKKAGYEEHTQKLSVPARGGVNIVLTKLPPGILVVKIFRFADVYIDGDLKERETDRYVTSLDPGSYTIELKHRLHGTVTRIVEIAAGDTTEVPVNMEEEGAEQ
ncbi:MAG: PEGA domain-containing protein [Candidatus Latescibacterota bacterium]|nr:MAG: PEGA domain-containing protein [Candidatus Latescibacterota bacterium]